MVEDTLAALQNPCALLENLREPLAVIYQELLAQAKMEKAASARNCVRKNLGMQGLKSWVAQKARVKPGLLCVLFLGSKVAWRN